MGGSMVLARRFEEHRPRLRAVAYRLLGSLGEAAEAVEEARLRLERPGAGADADPGPEAGAVRNADRALTAAVARVCLDRLRSRGAARREEAPYGEDGRVRLPDPVVGRVPGPGPGPDYEQRALLSDGCDLPFMTALDTLGPAERVALVLCDLCAVPSDEVAEVLGRTEASARQLADRARHRVRAAAPAPDGDPEHRREVVAAFLAAAGEGDLDALLAVLDPDVVARSDGGTLRPSLLRRGATTVAAQAVIFARLAEAAHLVLVNGAPGVMAVADGRVISVMSFTVRGGRVTALDVLTDPDRLTRLGLTALLD
ncbi:sigma factor-like helix-turn-helix DNA-binding protein [Streptomyces rubrolavendulae]|uniref:ECF RNA polymerase sigma factor SigJ n=1 Tax=Streptomyces rubrolavendulae TaxID=285473 RepID=A0A1D8G3I6_9ACTN|nr:sigma factor-like helix-turn-helix DNA-binding protein [Streptomyces rubrolavendulae]AOT60019.1 ECF RNA polymerase sigma factor SigJ [Streptomyces rubrolavendulae]